MQAHWRQRPCGAICGRLTVRLAVFLAVAAFAHAFASCAWATDVRPMSFDETAGEAEAIAVGRVVDVRSRWTGADLDWIVTDYVVDVVDAVLPAGSVQNGRRITLSFWGGTIDGRTQRIAGSPVLKRGRRYVLMLRPEWNAGRAFSPLVGFWHGFFPVASRYQNTDDVVVDHNGLPVFRLGNERIVKHQKALQAKAVPQIATLDDFIRTLRADLRRIKTAARARPWTPGLDRGPNAGPSSTPMASDSDLKRFTAQRPFANALAKLRAAASSSVPIRSAGIGTRVSAPTAPTLPGAEEEEEEEVDFWKIRPRIPVVMNVQPSTSQPWATIDQEAMAVWNFYAKDLFLVRPNANSRPAAWGNKVFDLHGFLDDEQMEERFGKPWEEGIISTNFSDVDQDGKVLEVDVALNAGYRWTPDNEQVLAGEPAESYWHVIITALGGVLRMPVYPGKLSMYRADGKYRPFSLPYFWDIAALREKYPESVTPRKDLGVCLYRVTESGQWEDAGFSAREVRRGETIEIQNYTIYNVGTEPWKPSVLWFLAPIRDVTDKMYNIIIYEYEPIEVDTAYTYKASKLTIPESVPAGEYYLGAFIKDDENIEIANFPYLNSLAFSRNKIKVTE